jgi:nitrogen-specific signal transduction histidine kinase
MNFSNNRNNEKERSKITMLQQQLFSEGVVSRKLLDAVPSPLLIINEQWQVVYANKAVITLIGGPNSDNHVGFKEGEAFHCVHYLQNDKESGRHPSCQVCGVARLLSRSLKGEDVSKDCHITCGLSEAVASLDLRVLATPLEFHGDHFSILSLVDISEKRRRELLENACHHDLLNTLTSLKGVLSVVKDDDIENQAQIFSLLERMTQDSIDEINSLRLLEKAEQKKLKPHPKTMRISDFLNFMREAFQYHPVAEGKTLTIEGEVSDQIIESDYQLVRRIIGNMLINAFEATELGGTIILSCCEKRDGVEFRVHNHKIIPKKIQRDIFYRDVTTKGHGRGTGTYSIKLLSSILGGEVQFTSTEPEGTTFSLWLPRQHKD